MQLLLSLRCLLLRSLRLLCQDRQRLHLLSLLRGNWCLCLQLVDLRRQCRNVTHEALDMILILLKGGRSRWICG